MKESPSKTRKWVTHLIVKTKETDESLKKRTSPYNKRYPTLINKQITEKIL